MCLARIPGSHKPAVLHHRSFLYYLDGHSLLLRPLHAPINAKIDQVSILKTERKGERGGRSEGEREDGRVGEEKRREIGLTNSNLNHKLLPFSPFVLPPPPPFSLPFSPPSFSPPTGSCRLLPRHCCNQ